MKTIYFSFLLLVPSFVFSQGLQIQLGGSNSTGKIVQRHIAPNHPDYTVPFTIYNNSPVPKTFYPKRILSKSLPADYTLLFAFNKSHYVPSHDIIQIIPDTVTLQPGEFLSPDANQYGLTPVLSTGATCVTFKVDCILMDINQKDSVKITMLYECANGIKGEDAGMFSAPYPVPSPAIVNIDYTFQQPAKRASLVLYNTLGKSIKELPLDNLTGKVHLDLSEFGSGLYFYSFIKDARVVHTGELLITDH